MKEGRALVFRVEVAAELYAWARGRSGRDREYLTARFPRLPEWESGEAAPTLRQLEDYAKATYTPIGCFFSPEPPDEELPIPDFRTVAGGRVDRPGADLLDTIYQCQRRQDWYQEYALRNGLDRVDLVGSYGIGADPIEAAAGMREALGWTGGERAAGSSERLRQLVDRAEQANVLVMVNGVVGNNTHRKLDPGEFRGFALTDDFAPVVFVNGADTKPAQIFTLVHELAHITAGRPGLDRVDLGRQAADRVERWCNDTAAEFLVPMAALRESLDPSADITDELPKLAHRFGVSTLVILRRLHDAGHLDSQGFRDAFLTERGRLLEIIEKNEGSGGGNFYNTLPMRTSRTFMNAIINSTLVGETLYRDAFRLLGIKKHSTFKKLVAHFGNR